jgi:hypothetical protein
MGLRSLQGVDEPEGTSLARFAGDDPFLAQEAQVAGDGIGAAEPEFGGNLLGGGTTARRAVKPAREKVVHPGSRERGWRSIKSEEAGHYSGLFNKSF